MNIILWILSRYKHRPVIFLLQTQNLSIKKHAGPTAVLNSRAGPKKLYSVRNPRFILLDPELTNWCRMHDVLIILSLYFVEFQYEMKNYESKFQGRSYHFILNDGITVNISHWYQFCSAMIPYQFTCDLYHLIISLFILKNFRFSLLPIRETT